MWIDAHSHVDRYELVDEHALPSALAQMADHHILTISNAMDLPSYRRALEIGEQCDWVIPAFGVHPWNAPQYVDRLHDLNEAIEQCPMIGEIGLDHYFVEDATAYPDQRKVLDFFLSAARDQNKIVTLHTKDAEREVLEMVDRSGVQRVIVHWYSGPLDIFRDWLRRGAYFTFGIELMYSEHTRTLARQVPQAQLLTETDSPGGPQGFLGRPGTPVLIKDVARALAEARNTTLEAIVTAVQANLVALVGKDPWLAGRCGQRLPEHGNGS